LSRNREGASRIKHGLVLACLGDLGPPNYKKSRRGDAEIDRAVVRALRERGGEFGIREFTPLGYDERQYGSPGFDLPIGSLPRTPNGLSPEYPTSADDLDFVRPDALADSLSIALAVVAILEGNRRYVSLNPHCEPQLGKRGLYASMGGRPDQGAREVALLWTL